MCAVVCTAMLPKPSSHSGPQRTGVNAVSLSSSILRVMATTRSGYWALSSWCSVGSERTCTNMAQVRLRLRLRLRPRPRLRLRLRPESRLRLHDPQLRVGCERTSYRQPLRQSASPIGGHGSLAGQSVVGAPFEAPKQQVSVVEFGSETSAMLSVATRGGS